VVPEQPIMVPSEEHARISELAVPFVTRQLAGTLAVSLCYKKTWLRSISSSSFSAPSSYIYSDLFPYVRYTPSDYGSEFYYYELELREHAAFRAASY